MKAAVVYYSFEGNTKFVAEKIASKFEADIYELKTVENKVPNSGFFKYFWGGKQVFMKETPEILDLKFNPNDYDVIFIGTPVWAFTYSPAIKTFMEKYRFQDKKVVVFCTHSGGIKSTLENMKKDLGRNEYISEFNIIDPLKHEEKSSEEIKNWLDSIQL
ncbi:MAG: NAD(P)H-dependent oxidoreductase [Clostridia bacterium]|nr:NAD(P)H-dependent oxidoreductase [Clostridia bacterium]